MDLYSEIILDHYKNPQNTGSLKKPTHTASEVNPFCGDGITVELKVKSEKLKVMKYKAKGCAISIASASLLSEYLIGEELGDIRIMTSDDLLKLLGIPLTPTRQKCALLPLLAVQKAIRKR